MSKSLQPGAVVGRFRVVSLLGAGGMGEVYLARDESLDRSVALKILPPELVKNDERVRRFIQEAKSASSLSHPSIVTIHEIGEADVDAAQVHFIAMELVKGSTLKDLIHTKKTDLRTLLRYLAQAAEGIAKAHAAGIVHRDLKPENIMVTDDGFAKVLDFGLAKLTEAGAGTGSVAETRTALVSPTGAGMILGTVGYMSPEQVQAKAVDHRSDIFSFGCILYEAATRQRPFTADSDLETLHQIVKERPTAVEELNAQVPTDVRRLIRRCLAKTPEQRLQSMKDLALELAEIAEQYDTLSISTGSGATTTISGAAVARPARSPWEKLAIAAAIVMGTLGLAAGGWSWFSSRPAAHNDTAAFGKMEITRLASIPDLFDAVMSPDGRFLAFTRWQPDKFRIMVRQLATGRDVEAVAPPAGEIYNLQFSPDGNYLFYELDGLGPASTEEGLYQVASLGGSPRRISMPDWPAEFSPSPDGSQLAATVSNHATDLQSLVVVNLDGTTPRSLTTFKPEQSMGHLAWSPDGRHIVGAMSGRGDQDRLIEISVKDGGERRLGSDVWQLRNLAWLPDGSGLIAVGREPDNDTAQLWLVSWPDGTRRRITNDANDYDGATISADARSIATISRRSDDALWIAPTGKLETATLVGDGRNVVAARKGAVLFLRTERGRDSIWSVSAGTAARRLTPERLDASEPYPAALANVVLFTGNADDGTPSMWRVDLDGGGLGEIPGGLHRMVLAVSPDGRTVFFRKSNPVAGGPSDPALWKMPVAGGAEEKVADADARLRRPAYSPDGKHFYRMLPRSSVDSPLRYEIVLAEGEKVVHTLQFLRDDGHIKWAHSSDALIFDRATSGAMNIWRMPLDGRPAQQITRFGAGQLGNYFAWTADGSHLVFRRNDQAPSDVLLIKNFR